MLFGIRQILCVVGALNMLLVTVRHTCASFNPRRLVLSERLLPPLAQPSGFLGHSVECSVHPPRELWQHGRSKHVSTCTCQYRCGSSKLLKCVFIFNQISDTTGNSRLCSTLWWYWSICGPVRGEETLESVQAEVRQSEEPFFSVYFMEEPLSNCLSDIYRVDDEVLPVLSSRK